MALTDKLKAIGDAIRSKTGGTDALTLDEMASIIATIEADNTNFKIVGGTTQPTSPKENTIWINTSTAIGEWQICATEPITRANGTALQNGDVWIQTTTSVAVSFNALKQNAIVINIAKMSQYISGTWSVCSGSLYKDTKWTTIDGVVTVLDTSTAYLASSWGVTVATNWNECGGSASASGGVNVWASNSHTRITEQTQRDFSKYSKIEIYVSSRTGGTATFGIITDKDAGCSIYGGHGFSVAKTIGTGTHTIDISNYNSKGYLAVHENTSGSTTITKIKLYV